MIMTWGRGITFVGVTALGVLAFGALRSVWPARLPLPELALWVVLYLGLLGRGAVSSQVAVALVIGYLVDLFVGAPRGAHALSLALLMLGARATANRLLLAGTWQVALVTFGAALVHGVLLIAFIAPLYGEEVGGGGGQLSAALRQIPSTALMTALFGPLAFAALRRFDRRFTTEASGLRGIG